MSRSKLLASFARTSVIGFLSLVPRKLPLLGDMTERHGPCSQAKASHNFHTSSEERRPEVYRDSKFSHALSKQDTNRIGLLQQILYGLFKKVSFFLLLLDVPLLESQLQA